MWIFDAIDSFAEPTAAAARAERGGGIAGVREQTQVFDDIDSDAAGGACRPLCAGGFLSSEWVVSAGSKTIRSVDKSRLVKRLGTISTGTQTAVLNVLAALFAP